jgi:DNA-binding XRE family transcriptional regulator
MIVSNTKQHRTAANNGKGISKAWLARKIGATRSYVVKLEQGKCQPSAEMMFRIASYFGKPIESVFQWVEEVKK